VCHVIQSLKEALGRNDAKNDYQHRHGAHHRRRILRCPKQVNSTRKSTVLLVIYSRGLNPCIGVLIVVQP
jgi:ABC-type nickel/cobalt efflux system permease component RcnA